MADEFAAQPVVLIEQVASAAHGDRISRFYAGGGGPSSAQAMVDSGQQVSYGSVDYDSVYRAMVQTALARPAQGDVSIQYERVGDRIAAQVTVTNLSETVLSSANAAAVHLLVYEEARVLWTGRYVRGGRSIPVTNPLAPQETRAFTLETDDLAVGDWGKVHIVALVDYRPGGSTGPYDMLQAAQVAYSSPEPAHTTFIAFIVRP